MNDIGIMVFFITYIGNKRTLGSCLSIESSTDFLSESDLEIELLCRNSSGIFNLGPVEYNSHITKCFETNGTIADPTTDVIKWGDLDRTRRFWTKIQRTGPHKGTIRKNYLI